METPTGLGERYRAGTAVSGLVFIDGRVAVVSCGGRAGVSQTFFQSEARAMRAKSSVVHLISELIQTLCGFGIIAVALLGRGGGPRIV